MPTYDYRCKACGHEMELFQSMSEAPRRKCPSCGKNALERLIGTGAAIVFKGSGFYQTDYRSESYKKAAEADAKVPANGEAKADKAGDKAADKPGKPDKASDNAGSKADKAKPAETAAKSKTDASAKTSGTSSKEVKPKPQKR